MYRLNLKEIDKDCFNIKDCYVAKQLCHLIYPKPSFFDWDETNLHLRSGIYHFSGHVISLSFKKFFNLYEKPHIEPFNSELKDCRLVTKEDGSTLIVSKYRGEVIMRSRQTVDAYQVFNNADLNLFKQTILPLLPASETWSQTYLFEYCSRSHRIILDYGPEPKFFLIGIINHEDYSLVSQNSLDKFAEEKGFNRPKTYTYYSLSHMLKDIEDREDMEGICIYHGDNHNFIRKCKSSVYLKLHAFKSNLAPKNFIDLYLNWGKPNKEQFLTRVEKEFDFECAVMAEETAKDVYEQIDKFNTKIDVIQLFVTDHCHIPQKDFALKLQKNFEKEFHGFAFSLRKDGSLSNEPVSKYLKQKFKIFGAMEDEA